jgi:hypothetical protein
VIDSSLFKNFEYIGVFESVEQSYKADVVVMKLIKDLKHRLLSLGEEEGR